MKNTLCCPPSKESKLDRVLLTNWSAPHTIKDKDGEKKVDSFPSYAKLFVWANKSMSFSLLSWIHCVLTRFILWIHCCSSPFHGQFFQIYPSGFRRDSGSTLLESLPGELQAEAAPVSRLWKQIAANLVPPQCLRVFFFPSALQELFQELGIFSGKEKTSIWNLLVFKVCN